VLRIGAKGILAKPLRTADILSSIVLARAAHAEMRSLQKKAQRLEQKLGALNVINDAKMILMRTRSMNEEQACTVIRGQAMSKRMSTEQIA
jgi:AmiR/NasT family two-component response regulator